MQIEWEKEDTLDKCPLLKTSEHRLFTNSWGFGAAYSALIACRKLEPKSIIWSKNCRYFVSKQSNAFSVSNTIRTAGLLREEQYLIILSDFRLLLAVWLTKWPWLIFEDVFQNNSVKVFHHNRGTHFSAMIHKWNGTIGPSFLQISAQFWDHNYSSIPLWVRHNTWS